MSWFAYGEDGWEAESERTLAELGIPVDRGSRTRWRTRTT